MSDLEAAVEFYAGKLGVIFTMEPTKQPWGGGFMALIADPDGNLLYLDEVAAAHS